MKLHLICGVAALVLALPSDAAAAGKKPFHRAATAPSKVADTEVAPLRCDGRLATIRTSAVRPGKWDEFQHAVTAHGEWYAQHGGGATVRLARVLHRNPRSGTSDYADREAVTITVFRDARAHAPQHDKAWDDFVAAYAASSRVEHEQRVCLPALT
jgi:hypothetical protein